MTDHNCEIPGWRCYGNGPIVLEVERFRIDNTEGYPYIDVYGHNDNEVKSTEVNYCPFCGFSETVARLSENNHARYH